MSTLNGVEFTRTGDPAADLKTYAAARGISEAKAKAELEAEFGVAKAVNNSADEDVSISDSVDDLSLDTETTSTSDTSDTKATDRERIQKEIENWSAKLKQATDAKDSYGVTKAQEVLKDLQTKAYEWDNGTSTSESSETSETTDTSESSESSDTKATDRERIQKEIENWSAKLKQATDAKDSYGVTKAQEVLKDLQTKAYEWDHS